MKRGKIKFEILILNLSCHDVVSNPLHATKLMIADKLFHQLSYCTCIICLSSWFFFHTASLNEKKDCCNSNDETRNRRYNISQRNKNKNQFYFYYLHVFVNEI